ncbi:probable chlorophyll(ide) b reductase NYC1, chloroplastic isoform X2 [Prosopis cineraria]|uniref:probable chlorophyll(ide) b reductase NYC1, chloroplastic isoform X2 n=1 Tax=Prosopis cineraria TaxID=364024 RepID=UPI00240F8D66|nr:probable chlorophyll(ide) b reductase NYC1, chloroplastic isoform X2 [Prosopis cineraria]
MTTLVKLRLTPESFSNLCFSNHRRTSSLRRGSCHDGASLRPCKAFRTEDGGDLKEKKRRNLKKDVVKLKREYGFWSSVNFILSNTFKVGSKSDDEYRLAVAKVEEVLSSIAVQIGRYIVTMMSTGVILAIGFQMSVQEDWVRLWLENSFFLETAWLLPLAGSPESVQATIKELEENLKEGIANAVGSSLTKLSHAKVVGIACDVCEPDDVQRLADFTVNEFGHVDIWINNAGTNKGFRPLLQFSDEDIKQIVSTNLVGSIICTREAMRIMRNQEKGGHIFNMDGAGSGGSRTPLTAVYGSTKCGLRQLQGSLLKECKRSKVGVHTASPGMVLTDLLLSGSTVQNKQMFNIICELPETVARSLVSRMRVVKGTGKAINYLTPPRILLALVTAWLRRGRWFDDQGRALYAAEADRLRNWAENRARFSFTDAMEMYTENAWISVFSLSVVCAFIILSSTGNNMPGT